MLSDRMHIWGNQVILIKDFNDILDSSEKRGGRPRTKGYFRVFTDFLIHNSLVDVGFKGRIWTWANYWDGLGLIEERLDRTFVNHLWILMYNAAGLSHNPNKSSGHMMLLLDTKTNTFYHKKRFIFYQRWLNCSRVTDIVVRL
ncbi:hypothetical protein ACH5RR_012576 [Cinchona calisaya]|uniref:Uncharacterized protein n=1 Tax=Cinchona calisaya TaxID=153742 RepID=A0ABD3ABJ0_9GENT